MTDYSLVTDPGMANALRAGRKRQMRVVQGSMAATARPGDLISLREAWVAGCVRHGRDHACSVRDAEFAVFADGWRLHVNGAGRQGRPPNMRRHHWASAALMPHWAQRTALVVTAIRQQRLRDMSTADLQAEGVMPVLAGWRWRLPRPLPGWFRTAPDAFADYWDTTHATPGIQWADNPYVIVLDICLHDARR